MPTTAQRLLDAQVAWHLARLSGDDLTDTVTAGIDDLLDTGLRIQVGQVIAADAVKDLVRLALARVPASAVASTVVGIVADTVYDGPARPFAAADLIDREHVEALLDALLSRPELLASVLDKVAESPLVASLASRFVARIVGDVLATNRAVADKIPGIGSLMNLGASVAGNVAKGVAGAADKQFDALFGDTAGKGATFAVRRLNKLLIETLSDPAAREAALQVFDLYADAPLGNAKRAGDRTDFHRLGGLVQDIIIGAAATEPVLAFADALVDAFFAVYAEQPVSSLVDDLGLSRDDLVEQATALLQPLLAHAVDSGEAERLIRARLEPFYASPEVIAILG